MKSMLSKVLRPAIVLFLALGIGINPQAQQGPYIVCSDIPWDPFEMVTTKLTGQEQYFGFDLDVMRAIAILEGYEITIQNMAFDAIIPAVQARRCDIGASGFTITAEREEVVDFSNPYWLTNQAVIVRRDSGFVSLDNVFCCNHRIGAQRGTTGAGWVQQQIDRGVDVQLVVYTNCYLAVRALVNGRIDAVVQDEPASRYMIAAYADVLVIISIIETNEYFGFLVAEGDPKRVLRRINEGMTKLGLHIVKTAAGTELWIIPGTPWENLVKAYFGPPPEVIEAAWLTCKDLLLAEKDVEGFASCMASGGNRPPQAKFTFSPARPVVGQPIRFDASASHDLDGHIVLYEWDFGDGTEEDYGMLVTHVFTTAGTYTVTLTVTDDGGSTDSITKEVKVIESGGGGGPA